MKTILDTELCWRVLLTLGHFLWQGALIALIAAAVAWMLRRASARARYGVWVVALLMMTLCPVATFVHLSLMSDEPPVLTTTSEQASAPPPASPVATPLEPRAVEAPIPAVHPAAVVPATLSVASGEDVDWRRYAPHLTTFYLLGVALMFGRLLLALNGARRLRRVSEPVTDPAILEMISRGSRAMRLRCVPTVAFCQEVVVPTVVGLFRPAILLPVAFASGLSLGQVEAILIHELEHIRRHDFLVNLFQRVAEAALFFHPAVWLVSRRIRIEREHCCDDAAVAACCEPMSYAESLVALAEQALATRAGRCTAAAVAMYAHGGSDDLRGRVSRILRIPTVGEVRLSVRPFALMAVLAASSVAIWAATKGTEPSVFTKAEMRTQNVEKLRKSALKHSIGIYRITGTPKDVGSLDNIPLADLTLAQCLLKETELARVSLTKILPEERDGGPLPFGTYFSIDKNGSDMLRRYLVFRRTADGANTNRWLDQLKASLSDGFIFEHTTFWTEEQARRDYDRLERRENPHHIREYVQRIWPPVESGQGPEILLNRPFAEAKIATLLANSDQSLMVTEVVEFPVDSGELKVGFLALRRQGFAGGPKKWTVYGQGGFPLDQRDHRIDIFLMRFPSATLASGELPPSMRLESKGTDNDRQIPKNGAEQRRR